jgi:hypothetical protein
MTAPRTRKTRVAPATVDLPLDDTAVSEAGGATQPGSSDTTADLGPILPDPTNLTIMGIPATVRRLQTREIMTGIRILVNEMGAGITELDLTTLMTTPDPDDEDAKAAFDKARTDLLGFLMVAAPGAADEVLKLLAGLVEAKDPKDGNVLESIMYNPPLGVTIDVIGVVFEQEREDLGALMGKARQLLGYAQALQRTQKAGT